jgi:cbb3-type cytochrome oxidase subunit 3
MPFTGAVTLVFICCWWYVIYDTPQEHPRISTEERNLILKDIPQYQNTDNKENVSVYIIQNYCVSI